MQIRRAAKQDFDEIYELVKLAFQTAEVSDGTEQEFVLQLRAGENYLPELEFVAEEEGSLIGHIMMTRQTVETEGAAFTGVLLAPLCVAQEYRNQRVGSALIRHAHRRASELGFSASFLVGNPLYYGRFGYRNISEFGIRNGTKIPDEFVLACELVPKALEQVSGIVRVI